MRRLWRLAKALFDRLCRLPAEAAVALGAQDRSQPARPARLLQAMLVVPPLALAGWWAMTQVTFVMSPSIEAWVVRPDTGPIGKGDYVMFRLSHALAGPNPVSVTKLALCMPGERLDMIEKPSRFDPREWDGFYFCNDRLLNVSKPFARGGAHLPHLVWGGPIPAGLVFVGSSAPNGFDSRYFGPVPISALTRMKRVL